jgi:hypothetical protein
VILQLISIAGDHVADAVWQVRKTTTTTTTTTLQSIFHSHCGAQLVIVLRRLERT